jgi:hypothetical protein
LLFVVHGWFSVRLVLLAADITAGEPPGGLPIFKRHDLRLAAGPIFGCRV